MSRTRKTGKGLPRRVYIKNNAWYYYPREKMRDPKTLKMKAWFFLAYIKDGYPAMLEALAKLLKDKRGEEGTMPHVCLEFKAKKLKKYTQETRDTYGHYLDVMAVDFEEFYAGQVTTKDWADFIRNNFSEKANTAKKYTALARRMFKYVIGELGLRQDNPIDQFDASDYATERRTILPTHDQVFAIREAGMYSKVRKDTGKKLPNPSGPMFACIIDMTYLCWARAVDVRTLKESQIDGDLILLQPAKTIKSSGKAVNIRITQEIQAVIDRARAIKKDYKVISPYLFCTRKGGAYKKGGLFSMWDRARDRIGINKDSSPEERIQFRDLRALGATDAARTGEAKDDIRKRLTHTTTKTSEIYIKEVIPELSEIAMKLPW